MNALSGFYVQLELKKWNRHSEKCDCAHFQKARFLLWTNWIALFFASVRLVCLHLVVKICDIFYDSIKIRREETLPHNQKCIKKLVKKLTTPPKIQTLPKFLKSSPYNILERMTPNRNSMNLKSYWFLHTDISLKQI